MCQSRFAVHTCILFHRGNKLVNGRQGAFGQTELFLDKLIAFNHFGCGESKGYGSLLGVGLD